MMRDGERLLGSQKTVLAVDREKQVCAVSEGRLRRVAERERSQDSGRKGKQQNSRASRRKRTEMRRGKGLVSPGWNLRLVPSTVPAVGSASPTSSPGSAGLPD